MLSIPNNFILEIEHSWIKATGLGQFQGHYKHAHEASLAWFIQL
jgi:hypothetical protein